MLSAINKINPGRVGAKIFGTWFMTRIEAEDGNKYNVMAEIRVYNEAIKIGDLIKIEYISENDEFRGLGNTMIKVAHKVPLKNKKNTVTWLWVERDVLLDDIVAMANNQDKTDINKMNENHSIGVFEC
jgi:hypothetical protein